MLLLPFQLAVAFFAQLVGDASIVVEEFALMVLYPDPAVLFFPELPRTIGGPGVGDGGLPGGAGSGPSSGWAQFWFYFTATYFLLLWLVAMTVNFSHFVYSPSPATAALVRPGPLPGRGRSRSLCNFQDGTRVKLSLDRSGPLSLPLNDAERHMAYVSMSRTTLTGFHTVRSAGTNTSAHAAVNDTCTTDHHPATVELAEPEIVLRLGHAGAESTHCSAVEALDQVNTTAEHETEDTSLVDRSREASPSPAMSHSEAAVWAGPGDNQMSDRSRKTSPRPVDPTSEDKQTSDRSREASPRMSNASPNTACRFSAGGRLDVRPEQSGHDLSPPLQPPTVEDGVLPTSGESIAKPKAKKNKRRSKKKPKGEKNVTVEQGEGHD